MDNPENLIKLGTQDKDKNNKKLKHSKCWTQQYTRRRQTNKQKNKAKNKKHTT